MFVTITFVNSSLIVRIISLNFSSAIELFAHVIILSVH